MIDASIARLISAAASRGRTGRRGCRPLATVAALTAMLAGAPGLRAQPTTTEGSEPTRTALIEQEQQAKAGKLEPYAPNKAEIWVKKIEEQLLTGGMNWHPFFTSAYGGGGFTLGAGYLTHVSDYNTLDVRGINMCEIDGGSVDVTG